MNLRLFESDDYSTLRDWCCARGIAPPLLSDLPRTGFIEDFCAVGFLIETDTPAAILDFYVSNPESSRKERSAALDGITKALMEHAKRRKFKTVLCRTELDVISIRATSHNFKFLGKFKSFSREL